jgi:hypothetical protein
MHHLDALLEIKELNAIQWTPGVGEPQGGSPKWYDLYKKILAGGKSIMACWVTLPELRPLLDNIGGDGVHVEMDFHNEQEVEQALRIVDEFEHARNLHPATRPMAVVGATVASNTTAGATVVGGSAADTFREEFVGESFGRINKGEAELTLLALQYYFNKIGKQRLLDERIDVGIISPYRAQVQYLRRLLMKREFYKPFRRAISVNTVDGFQGQERDIIVISLVRSNDDGQIGFLRDLRRMNVAITRARMKLIILGDKNTMTRHPFYRQLWQYIEGLSEES